MKKFYSALALVVTFSTASMAQTTITAAAMPQIGYVYNMASDTAIADLPSFTVSAGSSSAQTWDYSNDFNFVYGENTSFVAPSAGAGSANFPNATMAVMQPNGTDWVYFVSNSSGLYIDGAHVVVSGGSADLDLNPNSLFMATPSTLGTTNTATTAATATTVVSTYTVQVRHSANRTVTADAFGQLTTPAGTYPNTLRLRTYETSIDSAFFYILGSWSFAQEQRDTTLQYSWMQNSPDAQLLQISLNTAGAATKASYLQSFSNGIAAYAGADQGFNLYPNPTSDLTYLSYENKSTGPVSLQMFDMNGRMVGDLLNENQAIGKHKAFINVEGLHLPKGMYFLQLKNSEGIQNIKLSVQ